MEKIARAKINLCLHVTGHVTGQDNSGYHTLDSLVVLGEYGDILRVVPKPPAHGFSLQIEGGFGADLPIQNNIILSRGGGICGPVRSRYNPDKKPAHLRGFGRRLCRCRRHIADFIADMQPAFARR